MAQQNKKLVFKHHPKNPANQPFQLTGDKIHRTGKMKQGKKQQKRQED